MPSVRMIYASTSGNTEYVIETVAALLSSYPGFTVSVLRVEKAQPEDLLGSDLLILGCGTWNTGGIEGQLNPHMHAFLWEKAGAIDLSGAAVACISLGDSRYRYTTRCTEHFQRYVRERHGRMLPVPLVIVNEPYDQNERIRRWAEKLHVLMTTPVA